MSIDSIVRSKRWLRAPILSCAIATMSFSCERSCNKATTVSAPSIDNNLVEGALTRKQLTHLRKGMTPDQVEAILGRAMASEVPALVYPAKSGGFYYLMFVRNDQNLPVFDEIRQYQRDPGQYDQVPIMPTSQPEDGKSKAPRE